MACGILVPWPEIEPGPRKWKLSPGTESSDSKESACNAGDLDSIPGSGRSPGEGNGNTLQYFCLENPMDRGAWWATVHGVTKSQTWLSDRHTWTNHWTPREFPYFPGLRVGSQAVLWEGADGSRGHLKLILEGVLGKHSLGSHIWKTSLRNRKQIGLRITLFILPLTMWYRSGCYIHRSPRPSPQSWLQGNFTSCSWTTPTMTGPYQRHPDFSLYISPVWYIFWDNRTAHPKSVKKKLNYSYSVPLIPCHTMK